MSLSKIDLVRQATNSGDITVNNFKITNLATPVSSTDAATKAYVDATKQGLDLKDSVRAATTAAGTLATSFANGQVIDGITLATGDRILIKDQAAGAENGLYTVAASGAPVRAIDADANSEVTAGLYTYVESGTTNAQSGWVLTTTGAITIGTTALVFTQFSGAGQITAGAGLSKTGNTLDVNVDSSSIEINADTLRVKALGITNAMIAAATIDLAAKVTGILPVANGGTGINTTTAYGVILGGTTSTGAFQNAGAGSLGNVLTSNGASAAPTWQAPGAPSQYLRRITLSGLQNGSNKAYTYTGSDPTTGTDHVYFNGILLNPSASLNAGNDYFLDTTTNTITFDTTFTAPASTDIIQFFGMI